eukprot:c5370_g1_i2.p1 GENE.c5370_g1_i2~~c5370_g1_i2.p1  ORF type:complete len:135 (-),score=42.42 c5370_g1_i2:71-475(-)
MILNSGLAGISRATNDTNTEVLRIDVKCLHAQVADLLCRGPGSNDIAQHVLNRLTEMGIAIDGNDICKQQCGGGGGGDGAAGGWNYRPAKNKQKLKQKRERRRIENTKEAKQNTQQVETQEQQQLDHQPPHGEQ